MVKPIEMPFGTSTLVGPRNHVLNGADVGATWRIRVNRPCAAVMRPFCQITLTTCYLLVMLAADFCAGCSCWSL